MTKETILKLFAGSDEDILIALNLLIGRRKSYVMGLLGVKPYDTLTTTKSELNTFYKTSDDCIFAVLYGTIFIIMSNELPNSCIDLTK